MDDDTEIGPDSPLAPACFPQPEIGCDQPGFPPLVRFRGRGAESATPYLRKWLPELRPPVREVPFALDLGSGNRRNAEHLRASGWMVRGFDAHPECGVHMWLAGNRLPDTGDSEVHLVLCQYLLMFCTDRQTCGILDEVDRVLRPGGHALFEIEQVKQGRPVRLDRVRDYICAVGHGRRPLVSPSPYETIHWSKRRCILRKKPNT